MTKPIRADEVRRIHYGYFICPPGYPEDGQPMPVSGYLVRHPGGTLLFDTGMAPADDEVRERYHPRLRSTEEALAANGVALADIDVIANCHMHIDHAGGNHHFPGVPVLVQRPELEAAGGPDYTWPAFAYEYTGARIEVIEGEVEVAPGIRLIPTPGHSPGHQSLLIDTDIGPILLIGQATTTASEFSFAALSERLAADDLDRIGQHPEWMARLRQLGVVRGLFAHDLLAYEADPADIGHPRLS